MIPVVAYQESVKRDLLGVTAESVLTAEAAIARHVHQFSGSPEEICDQARRHALIDLVDALSHDL